ncbi:flippase [Methylosinus sporium]|uniref:Flippase n=2 Tax=Methylosinus sporium TaxID=428 RepID=A0A2U1SVF7_METSR|nr:flippase [Methylosinus sporium]
MGCENDRAEIDGVSAPPRRRRISEDDRVRRFTRGAEAWRASTSTIQPPAIGWPMNARGIRTNFMFNVAGALAPLIIALVTVPIYVSHIGAARYGALSIVWVLLGYFGFLDLGMSRASANALAKHEEARERSSILVTAFAINLALGVAGGLVLYIGGRVFLQYLLDVPPELEGELDSVFPWLACVVPMTLLTGVASGALESRERFLTINALQIAGSIVGQVLPVLCAVLVSPSLSVVVPAAVLARFPLFLLMLAFVIRREGPLSLTSFDRPRAGALLNYGGWISVTNFLAPLIVSLDQLVIGSALGLAAVTYYVVPLNVVLRTQIFAAALSRTLFPRMSRLQGDDARRLTESAIGTLAHGYAVACSVAIVLIGPFMNLWMGPDFAVVAAPIAEILMIGAWINGIAFLPFAHLQGQGRPDIISKYLALELFPFLLVLWLATRHFGIEGSAYAWVARAPVHLLFLLAMMRFEKTRYAQLVLPFGCVMTAFVLVRLVRPGLFESLLIASAFAVSTSAIAFAIDQNIKSLFARLKGEAIALKDAA